VLTGQQGTVLRGLSAVGFGTVLARAQSKCEVSAAAAAVLVAVPFARP